MIQDNLIKYVLEKKGYIGLNSANRCSAGCSVYYTSDAPLSKLCMREGIKYNCIDINHTELSKKLGVDYPIHFITIHG